MERFMKILVLVLVLMVTSCAKKSGMTEGVLVDAANEGVFVTSCEIDVQYGKESSRIENFSSRSSSLCEELMAKTGSKVKIKYHYENFSFTTNDNHIIDDIQIQE
jgi:hypothetical protein